MSDTHKQQKPQYKPIFSYNSDIHKNAYLNWRMEKYSPWDNFCNIADSYRDSAIELLNHCLSDEFFHEADGLIFPILFNANHAIELYLKSIMWEIHLLENDRTSDFVGGHDIRQLFQTTMSLVKEVSDKYGLVDDKKNIKSELANTEAYINELYLILYPDTNGAPEKKENLDFSRYPVDRDKHPYFYSKDPSKNVTIDLENCLERFKEIGETLSCIDSYYCELLDRKMEYEADMLRELEAEMSADMVAEMYDLGFE